MPRRHATGRRRHVVTLGAARNAGTPSCCHWPPSLRRRATEERTPGRHSSGTRSHGDGTQQIAGNAVVAGRRRRQRTHANRVAAPSRCVRYDDDSSNNYFYQRHDDRCCCHDDRRGPLKNGRYRTRPTARSDGRPSDRDRAARIYGNGRRWT